MMKLAAIVVSLYMYLGHEVELDCIGSSCLPFSLCCIYLFCINYFVKARGCISKV